MRSSCLPALVLAMTALLFGLATLLGTWTPASAEDAEPARKNLEDHPLADAKAGEYLRYVEEAKGYKKWFVERVLDTREGEVLYEVFVTNEDGTEDKSSLRRGWRKIPKLKPNRKQEVKTDEMVALEVDGKSLWCRHFILHEWERPDYPEPKVYREVWYSNDIPCSGKVKDTRSSRIVTSWGMMSADETQKRKRAFEEAEKREREGGDREAN